MKKYQITFIMLLATLLCFISCKDRVDFYTGPDAVIFSTTSTVFSFVAYPGQDEGYIHIPLTLIGRTADNDRHAAVEIITDGTTAAGSMYEVVGATIPAGSMSGEVIIKVFRVPQIENSSVSLALRLADSNELVRGAKEHLSHRSEWSAQLLRPVTWDDMSRFCTPVYSSSAYRAVIEATGLTEFYFYDQYGELIYDSSLSEAYMKVAGRKFGDWIREYNAKNTVPYLHDDGEMAGSAVIPVY